MPLFRKIDTRHFLFSLIATTLFVLLSVRPAVSVQPIHGVSPIEVIRVVMDNNYPPYSFTDEEGRLKGIIIDQWRLWEKKTGIRAELHGMDWDDAKRRMEAGEFDVIDTIFRNPQREKLYGFTKPYARLDVPLFFHTDISGIRGTADLKGFLVAAKAGDNVIDVLKNEGITNIEEYPSYEALIKAARDGKVRIFTVDRPPALYYLNKMGIQSRFHETKPLYSGEFHRGVAKGNTALLSQLEKGFAAITPAEYRAIDKRWMGSPIVGSPYVRYAGYAVGSIAAILCSLLAGLVAMKRVIARKT